MQCAQKHFEGVRSELRWGFDKDIIRDWLLFHSQHRRAAVADDRGPRSGDDAPLDSIGPLLRLFEVAC